MRVDSVHGASELEAAEAQHEKPEAALRSRERSEGVALHEGKLGLLPRHEVSDGLVDALLQDLGDSRDFGKAGDLRTETRRVAEHRYE